MIFISEYKLNTNELKKYAPKLKVFDRVLLSGTVYTARDAAHKRIALMLDRGEKLPFELDGACIYYAGPTGTPKGLAIGACGPTTSGRMDVYAPRLLDLGLTAMIGKGERSGEVVNAVIHNKAVYLCAVGGAGALACERIKSCEVIAFEDLGCESVKRLEFSDFPLIVAVDCSGGDIFKSGRQNFLASVNG